MRSIELESRVVDLVQLFFGLQLVHGVLPPAAIAMIIFCWSELTEFLGHEFLSKLVAITAHDDAI